MQIITTLDQLKITSRTSVALGNFDGIHIGHREIMQNAIDVAAQKGLKSLCFTFSNHPFNFILRREDSDPDAVKLICTEEEKIALIEDMGFDILVNVPFDERIMKMRAHDFFATVVVRKLKASHVSVGFNYTYGARAEGKPDTLRQECADAGISLSIRDAVLCDGHVVSSTLIREKISRGDMESVCRYLGRPLSFSGIVEHGKRLGSTNGVPTANITLGSERMLPPNGVYFSRVLTEGREYKSVSNVGTKPTVSTEETEIVESSIFDFNGDLYGKKIVVFLDHYSRKEIKFDSIDALFSQIAEDCRNALEYHSKESK